MKSVLISIKPEWVEKITSGKKTIEVRKTAPKEVPFKAYIYCSYGDMKTNYYLKGRGEVIGEFICDKVYKWGYDYCDGVDIDDDLIVDTCLDRENINIYAKGKTLYGWHISDLKIYDKPKELCEFGRKCDYASEIHCRDCLILGDWDSCCGVMCKPLTRPPQSWQYVKELENEQRN